MDLNIMKGISELSLHISRDSRFMTDTALRAEPPKNHGSTADRQNIFHSFLKRPDMRYEVDTGRSFLGSKAVGR
jgi:hypothetical protein